MQRVANRLYATEGAVDAAMLETAELMADLVQARKDLGLSAVVADGATRKLAEAMATLSEARSAVVAAHHELNNVKLRLGVRTKMIGFEKLGEANRGLQDVAELREAI